jgi:hypothetical protein
MKTTDIVVSSAEESDLVQLEASTRLANSIIDLINEQAARSPEHPATVLSAMVHVVSLLLASYRVPPGVFVDRVIIAMGTVR